MQPLEHFEGIDDIVRRYGPAVMPLGGRMQSEAHPGEVGGIAYRLGDEPVFTGDFVQRRRHERVVDEFDALAQVPLYAGDHDIEAVESTDSRPTHRSTLGRIGIYVVKMPESGGIFEVSQQRCAVGPGGSRGRWAHFQ